MSYIENLEKQLFEMQDLKYRDFHSKLLPGIDRETIIGIRTPMLRKFTKEFAETLEAELFLKDLPHRYYEENNMHMMIISWIKDYEVCLKEVKKLLPYVNNWATCDLPAPKCFAKHKEELLPEIRNWISSGETYTIRYGTGMLMNFYLDSSASEDNLSQTSASTLVRHPHSGHSNERRSPLRQPAADRSVISLWQHTHCRMMSFISAVMRPGLAATAKAPSGDFRCGALCDSTL